MMYGFGNYGAGMGGFGWIFMIIFWGAIIYIIVSFLKKNNSNEKESAEEILKKRYAKGEISKEEFEQMKKQMRE